MMIDYLVLIAVYLAGSYFVSWFVFEYVFPALSGREDDE
jgi:hypothetical protein